MLYGSARPRVEVDRSEECLTTFRRDGLVFWRRPSPSASLIPSAIRRVMVIRPSSVFTDSLEASASREARPRRAEAHVRPEICYSLKRGQLGQAPREVSFSAWAYWHRSRVPSRSRGIEALPISDAHHGFPSPVQQVRARPAGPPLVAADCESPNGSGSLGWIGSTVMGWASCRSCTCGRAGSTVTARTQDARHHRLSAAGSTCASWARPGRERPLLKPRSIGK